MKTLNEHTIEQVANEIVNNFNGAGAGTRVWSIWDDNLPARYKEIGEAYDVLYFIKPEFGQSTLLDFGFDVFKLAGDYDAFWWDWYDENLIILGKN